MAVTLTACMLISEMAPAFAAWSEGEGLQRAQLSAYQRQTLDFNTDWLFIRGDVTAAKKLKYDDSGAEKISLPHARDTYDLFNPDYGSIKAVDWYRRHFTLSEKNSGKRVLVEFNGGGQVNTVYVNGALVGEALGTFTHFQFDITDYITFGDYDNVIAVQVDSTWHESDLPPGDDTDIDLFGGLHGRATMTIVDPAHIDTVFYYNNDVTTGTSSATVYGQIEVKNDYETVQSVSVESVIYNANGSVVSTQTSGAQSIPASSTGTIKLTHTVSNPHLWSTDDPYLYTVKTEVLADGVVVDQYENTLGIRTLKVANGDGRNYFTLNGEEIYLLGGNRHMQAPYLGNSLPVKLNERDAYVIKYDLGYNFVRTSHYENDPAFLDACDRYGLLVEEEPLGWEDPPAVAMNQFFESLKTMVKRDRNHPSIVMWSVLPNERSLNNPPQATATQWISEIKALDPSRLTIQEENKKGAYALADVMGLHDYEQPGTAKDPENATSWVVTEWNTSLGKYFVIPGDSEARKVNQVVNDGAKLAYLMSRPKIMGNLKWDIFGYMTSQPGNVGKRGKNVGYWRSSGVYGLWRDPLHKTWIAWLLAAQSKNEDMGDVLKICSEWKSDSGPVIYVATNLDYDSVKLYYVDSNGARQEVTAKEKDPGTASLDHGLIMFTLTDELVWAEGTRLMAEGTGDNGEVMDTVWASTYDVETDGAELILHNALDPEIYGDLEADGSDVAWILATLVDKNGQREFYGDENVTVTKSGPGVLVHDGGGASGPRMIDGISGFYLRSEKDQTGTTTIKASVDIGVNYDDGDPMIEYDGNWTVVNNGQDAYLGGYHQSTAAGATATITFMGTQIVLYAESASTNGEASVTIDDGTAETATCWNNADYATIANQAVYRSPVLAYGEHTLVITANSANAINIDRIKVFDGVADVFSDELTITTVASAVKNVRVTCNPDLPFAEEPQSNPYILWEDDFLGDTVDSRYTVSGDAVQNNGVLTLGDTGRTGSTFFVLPTDIFDRMEDTDLGYRVSFEIQTNSSPTFHLAFKGESGSDNVTPRYVLLINANKTAKISYIDNTNKGTDIGVSNSNTGLSAKWLAISLEVRKDGSVSYTLGAGSPEQVSLSGDANWGNLSEKNIVALIDTTNKNPVNIKELVVERIPGTGEPTEPEPGPDSDPLILWKDDFEGVNPLARYQSKSDDGVIVVEEGDGHALKLGRDASGNEARYLVLPDSLFDGMRPDDLGYRISFRMKRASPGSSQTVQIGFKGEAGSKTANPRYALRLNGSKANFLSYNSSATLLPNAEIELSSPSNNWQTIVLEIRGDTASFCLNDKEMTINGQGWPALGGKNMTDLVSLFNMTGAAHVLIDDLKVERIPAERDPLILWEDDFNADALNSAYKIPNGHVYQQNGIVTLGDETTLTSSYLVLPDSIFDRMESTDLGYRVSLEVQNADPEKKPTFQVGFKGNAGSPTVTPRYALWLNTGNSRADISYNDDSGSDPNPISATNTSVSLPTGDNWLSVSLEVRRDGSVSYTLGSSGPVEFTPSGTHTGWEGLANMVALVNVMNARPVNIDNLKVERIPGTGEEPAPEVNVNTALNSVTASVQGGRIQLTNADVPGANIYVRGSVLENLVTNDGKVTQWNIVNRNVTLLLRAEKESDPSTYAEKNVTVTVPQHRDGYPSGWFASAGSNSKPGVIPAIQEWYGYDGNLTLSAASRIVINDAGKVGLVDKVAANMQADLKEITGLTLPVVTGSSSGPNDIYIESLTQDEYDLGDEGYLMRVSDEGVQIWARTYTGCLFGTITVEQILWLADDHLSVPKGVMRDYPAYEVRGLMLDIARTPYRYELLQDYAKIMLWYKMSEYHLHINDNDNANFTGSNTDTWAGFHRLESETFPGLVSEVKQQGFPSENRNADYYLNNADYQGNPTYTKQQWWDLTELAQKYGMYLLTEIDLPGHSLLYNKYAAEHMGGTFAPGNSVEGSSIELLDLTGPNSTRALEFAKDLWNEYTDKNNPTIYGDIVHIGADEYWIHTDAVNNAFAKFADEMRKVIQGNLGENTKIRMWGAGASSFQTAGAVLGKTPQELAQNYQLDIWSVGYDNPKARTNEGFSVVNCRDIYLYGNPGRTKRDVANAEWLYNNWNPTMFDNVGNTTKNPMLGEPNLIGAKTVIWGDQSQEGMTELDVHQRVMRSIAIMSEMAWTGANANANQERDDFSVFELRSSRLAEGPGTNIAMEIDSASSLVLDYDFSNISADGKTIYDASGNGYNAASTGVLQVDEDGWLTFDGSTLLKTPLRTLSYPYTVSFDLLLTESDKSGNNSESSLLSGYDGRIQVAGYNGKMTADVNYFRRNFDYEVNAGQEVNITIVGTFQATRLYVNGELVAFLSQKENQDQLNPGVDSVTSSVPLPLEKIGQDFHGKMANLKVYNKALSLEEVRAAYEGEGGEWVNVAQNADIGGHSPTGDAPNQGTDGAANGLGGDQRIYIAMKAVDGDTFPAAPGSTEAPAENGSELYSYWQGDANGDYLIVDLGRTRTVSRFAVQWRGGGRGKNFSFWTSDDGAAWTKAAQVTGNQPFLSVTDLEAPITARYVKLVCESGYAATYKVQEFMVYEYVDKSGLEWLVEDARALLPDGVSFGNVGNSGDLFQAIVLGEALLSSPLATCEEVEAAVHALQNAIRNEPGHEHSLDYVEAKEPTYEAPGNIEYWHCKDCDMYFKDKDCTEEITKDQTVIPALTKPTEPGHEHSLDHVEAKKPTYEAPGNIEYWHCKDCDRYFKDKDCTEEITKDQTMIPALTKPTEPNDPPSSPSAPSNPNRPSAPDISGVTTETVTSPEGVTGTTTKDQNGNISSVEILIPANVAGTGDIVTAPVEVGSAGSTAKAPGIGISVSGGGSAKVEIPVSNVRYGTVAVVVDKDGNETILRDCVVTENGVVLNVDGNVTVKIVENGKTFPDTADVPWAEDAIAFTSARELFLGSDTGFEPNKDTSRAMIVTLLYRLKYEPDIASIGFADVSSDQWYASAVNWGQSSGVVKGYSTSAFAPEDIVTREQIALMLYRYAQLSGIDISTRADLSGYVDSDQLSDWAEDAMQWAVAMGLFVGDGNGVLDPSGNATRAQVAVLLMRFCEKKMLG